MDDAAAVPRRRSGLAIILVATAVAGVASYLLTWIVPRVIGFADYATFAIFWAALYLVVGTLSGLQQEVTRATVPLLPGATSHVNRARNFGIAVAGVTFVVVLAVSVFWAGALALPLAVGTASYALVAVLGGSLFGLSQWRSAAALVIADAVLRLLAVCAVLLFTHDIAALAWAAALPFGLALVLMWPFVRGHVVGKAQLDVGYGQLSVNVSRTLLAAASTGVMVSGFPLLLGVTSPGAPAAILGLYILAITLVRAPLVVVASALQGYLIVQFRDAPDLAPRRFLRIQLAVAGVGIVLCALGWFVGPAVFAWLFPGEPVPDGWFVAALVASSALVAAVYVSGSVVLARAQHLAYSVGWLVGAVATMTLLVLPVDFATRTILALLVAPVAALAVHVVSLMISSREPGDQ